MEHFPVKLDLIYYFDPNRKTPTSSSGSGTPYSALVTKASSTIVSSGEYRRKRTTLNEY